MAMTPIAMEPAHEVIGGTPDDMRDTDVGADGPGGDPGMDVDVVQSGAPAPGFGCTIHTEIGQSGDDINEEYQDLRAMIMMYDVSERRQAREKQQDVMSIVESMGGNGRSYQRERGRRARAIVSEVYSAPRVTELARLLPKYGCAPGLALDLTTGWDFSKRDQREKAELLLDTERPLLLVGSPSCTPFSVLTHCNKGRRDPEVVARERVAGMVHLAWCCKLYLKQLERGHYFLHEHPAGASSWDEQCIREVWAKVGVRRVVAHQCQLGQCTDDGSPVKKPTGFMSNSSEILEEFNVQCFGRKGICTRAGGGQHVPCQGKVARRAAIFQHKLCEAILIGLRNQMGKDKRMRPWRGRSEYCHARCAGRR